MWYRDSLVSQNGGASVYEWGNCVCAQLGHEAEGVEPRARESTVLIPEVL